MKFTKEEKFEILKYLELEIASSTVASIASIAAIAAIAAVAAIAAN